MAWDRQIRKRFYKEAAAIPVDGGWGVALDGRALRTPLGAPLVLPAHGLAQAVAGEWADQGDEIEPPTMPITRLSTTAIDRIAGDREAVVAELAKYAGTDLLCYRADGPAELVARQTAAWDPLLQWAEETFGARLTVTAGIIPVTQPREAVEAFQEAMLSMGNLELAALSAATAAAGSLVIALALADGYLDAEDAFALSQLDEDWQIEQWGEDTEAIERREQLRADIDAAAAMLDLLRE